VREGDSGITLIEVMVSLALFSLIGMAGFSIADAVLSAQRHTDGRLERLGQIQRAMHLMILDFEQVAGVGMKHENGELRFRRLTPGGPVDMSYRAGDGALRRSVDRRAEQTVLTGVEALTWRFLHVRNGWVDTWPLTTREPPALPEAIAAEMTLAGDGLSGTLRRVVRLPRGGE